MATQQDERVRAALRTLPGLTRFSRLLEGVANREVH